MTHVASPPEPPETDPASRSRPIVLEYLRLARPRQWAKSVFVLVGPLYSLLDSGQPLLAVAWPAMVASIAFGLASSACYVVNDIVDAPRDRLHPRKRRRPIAAGTIKPGPAKAFAGGLLLAAALLVGLGLPGREAVWTGALVGVYVGNVWLYSLVTKRVVIADVMGLSLGFVLRVIGGCAAVGIWPSTWLLNGTLFLAMFLSFGKRLGERRTMGEDAAAIRGVQALYTDELLRMSVVVTAVGALITYAGYVQDRAGPPTGEVFNLLWLTMLPATYGLLRCIVLLERGVFDDPTELAARDRPVQAATVVFAGITLLAVVSGRFAELETGERMPLRDDRSSQQEVLGEVLVPAEVALRPSFGEDVDRPGRMPAGKRSDEE